MPQPDIASIDTFWIAEAKEPKKSEYMRTRARTIRILRKK